MLLASKVKHKLKLRANNVIEYLITYRKTPARTLNDQKLLLTFDKFNYLTLHEDNCSKTSETIIL